MTEPFKTDLWGTYLFLFLIFSNISCNDFESSTKAFALGKFFKNSFTRRETT